MPIKTSSAARNNLNEQINNLKCLPDDLLSFIFGNYLHLRDIINLAQVNKSINRILKKGLDKHEVTLLIKSGNNEPDKKEVIADTYSKILDRLKPAQLITKRLSVLENSTLHKYKKFLDESDCVDTFCSGKDKVFEVGTACTLTASITIIASTGLTLVPAFLAKGVYIMLGAGGTTVFGGMGSTFFCSKKAKSIEKEIKELHAELKDKPTVMLMNQ